jgi:hypothetical protein
VVAELAGEVLEHRSPAVPTCTGAAGRAHCGGFWPWLRDRQDRVVRDDGADLRHLRRTELRTGRRGGRRGRPGGRAGSLGDEVPTRGGPSLGLSVALGIVIALYALLAVLVLLVSAGRRTPFQERVIGIRGCPSEVAVGAAARLERSHDIGAFHRRPDATGRLIELVLGDSARMEPESGGPACQHRSFEPRAREKIGTSSRYVA